MRLHITWLLSVGVFLLLATAAASTAEDAVPVRIAKTAADFHTTTLTEQSIERAKKDGLLTGVGEATYELSVPTTGWYALYVQATQWSTDLFLDGEFLLHTAFQSGVWEAGESGAHKTTNLYLPAGAHALTFSRPWHPGLPFMRRFYLQSAQSLADRVRLTPEKDYLIFRRGEAFAARLVAGRGAEAEAVVLRVSEAEGDNVVQELRHEIPAGGGNMEATLVFPTATEGTFDVEVLDTQGNHVDRTIQYCVVDTGKPSFPTTLKTELVEVVDATTRAPDYTRGETRVVNSPLGAYRESADLGREGGTSQAAWFAYTLNLPKEQADYLLRIEYPDDDQRQVAIVLVERDSHPMPAQGYSTGGVYPLAKEMQTQDFYFTARDRDPRIMFYNWNTGQRAALARITVYRITTGFPSLQYGPEGRMYGMYQEEPMRFLNNFGARMSTEDALSWVNFRQTAERVGQRLNYAGINLWFPTIAIYGNTLWPCKSIPGYQVGILPPGPATLKEPFKKDVMRLMLLVAEKYGLNFIGDLNPSNVLLDQRLKKEAGIEEEPELLPWVTVSGQGEKGARTPYRPYYTPLYPGVQAWTGEVFTELAERYSDYPAFKGVRIRLMLYWAFDGWQTFRSLDWGYEDYTVGLFARETGIEVPVAPDDPGRFRKRYEYLVRNHYEAWVSWRCQKIYDYHSRLAAILTAARPDLKLYLNPGSGTVQEWREAGIDPTLYAKNPAIVLTAARGYPDPGNRNPEQPLQSAANRDKHWDATPLQAVETPLGEGSVTGLELGTNMEGRYAAPEELGYELKTPQNTVVYPDATVNPAGLHYLQRFASAMADGNVTFMHDGSHGYVLGQPEYLRPFLAEYRALPVIGMRLLEDSDPVVLWHGRDATRRYFYLINRAWYPVEASVRFSRTPQVERLTTGKTQETPDNRLTLRLEPYQLLAFGCDREARPTELALTVPRAEQELLRAQLTFIQGVLTSRPKDLEVVALSPEDLRRAEARMAEAEQCLEAGETWRTRILLLHSDMIKLYEGFHAYPSGLFHRKQIPLPGEALHANAIQDKLPADGDAQLRPGESLAPGLTGQKVLLLGKRRLALPLDIPYTGRYRMQCGFLTDKSFQTPTLTHGGRPVARLGEQRGTEAGLMVSMPLMLRAGQETFTLERAEKGASGVLGLHLEPIYRDLTAQDFYAIGPFPGAMGWLTMDLAVARMATPDFPEQEIDLDKTYEVQGKTLAWVRPQEGIQSTDAHAPHYIDLQKTFGEISAAGKGSLSYAMTRVESPEARRAELSIGVDYWAKVWVNGEVVFEPDKRPVGPPRKGESKFPISLQKGTNTILFKIHAGSNGNGFWAAITDPGDLRYLTAVS